MPQKARKVIDPRRLLALKLATVVTLILGLPALCVRLHQALELPFPLRIVAIALIAGFALYDVRLIRKTWLAQPDEFTWRGFGLAQLPRLAFVVAIALAIDLPVYNVLLRAAFKQMLTNDVAGRMPAGPLRDHTAALAAERYAFVTDPIPAWLPLSPYYWEDKQRSAFLNGYEFAPAGGFTAAQCSTFFKAKQTMNLSHYPALATEFTTLTAVCDDRLGNSDEAADLFIQAQRQSGYDVQATFRHDVFEALFTAERDVAAPPTIRVLQEQLERSAPQERVWVRDRCVHIYFSKQGRAASPTFRMYWQYAMGPVCAALGSPAPKSYVTQPLHPVSLFLASRTPAASATMKRMDSTTETTHAIVKKKVVDLLRGGRGDHDGLALRLGAMIEARQDTLVQPERRT